MRTRKNTKLTRSNFNDKLFGDYLYMLVNKHIRKMAGKFYSILDQDDINDIVHDAYLKVIDKRHQYREDGNFEGWVFRICQNYVREITPKRSKKVVAFASYDWDGSDDSVKNDSDYMSYMADLSFSPDKEMCQREAQETIMNAVSRLKGDNLKVAEMMIDGYSTDDMEELLGCNNGNLRAKICRTRKELKSYGIGA